MNPSLGDGPFAHRIKTERYRLAGRAVNPSVIFRYASFLLLAVSLLGSCSTPNQGAVRLAAFEAACAAHPKPNLKSGSVGEKEALERFQNLLTGLEPTKVAELAREVYSEDAYFNDTLKTLHGSEAISSYLLHTAENVDDIQVTMLDVARSGPDYYLRWKMVFQAPKLRRGQPIVTIGITQARFNAEGQVVLHQDYWDSAAGLYEHVPVLGSLVHAIQQRL